jgi:hypothetical protein
MGPVPFYVLTGKGEHREYVDKKGVTSWKWSGLPISKARGYRFEGLDGIPVVPTFHSSYLGRGKMNLIPIVIWDLLRALDERDKPAPAWPVGDLTLYPDPAAFNEWLHRASNSSFLVHDIETAYSREHDEDDEEQDPSYEITRFSLANDRLQAITAPWQEPFITMLKSWLGVTTLPLVGWNSHEFDNPRERAAGWPIDGHRLVDARWLWHYLQPSYPQSLGAVTTFYDRVPEWKSLGSDGDDPELYSAMDARETAVCYLGIMKALGSRRLQ